MSDLETILAQHIDLTGLPEPAREHRFHPERRWRFDFAWPHRKIAAEVEGATYANGRHTRGSGFAKDCEKYNAACLLGWRVFRFTGQQVKSGQAITTIETALLGDT